MLTNIAQVQIFLIKRVFKTISYDRSYILKTLLPSYPRKKRRISFFNRISLIFETFDHPLQRRVCGTHSHSSTSIFRIEKFSYSYERANLPIIYLKSRYRDKETEFRKYNPFLASSLPSNFSYAAIQHADE